MEIESSFQRRIQKQGLEIMGSVGVLGFANPFYTYVSGEIGPYYIQSAQVISDGKSHDRAVGLMKELISHVKGENGKGIDIITGGEVRDLVFSLAMARDFRKPHTLLYKSGKAIGAILKDRICTHIADTNNEGHSIEKQWVPTVRSEDGRIKDVFFFIDRLEGGHEVVKKLGLKSYSVVPLDVHAWDYLLENRFVRHEIYSSIRRRMEDKKEWGYRMLRSEAGINYLAKLIQTPHEHDKAMKVLDFGYVEIREELVERLGKLGVRV